VTVPGTSNVTDWTSHTTSFRGDLYFTNVPAGVTISASQSIETANGSTGPIPLGTPGTVPYRTTFLPQGTLVTDNLSVSGLAMKSSATAQDLLSTTWWFGTTQNPRNAAFPAIVAPFSVTQALGSPGDNLFGATVPLPSGSETTVMVAFTGNQPATAAANTYLIIATKAWMDANGNTIAMDSKSSAGFPGAAFLSLPLISSSVSRTSTNITGSAKPFGSFASTAQRIQFP
jgi:hypothetical protein